jgi:hypothetical protein
MGHTNVTLSDKKMMVRGRDEYARLDRVTIRGDRNRQATRSAQNASEVTVAFSRAVNDDKQTGWECLRQFSDQRCERVEASG